MTKNKDYQLDQCAMCKTATRGVLKPGTPCQSKSCDSYLIVALKGRRKGKLEWHHPMVCEEWEPEVQPCLEGGGPCGIYIAVGAVA